MLSRLERRDNWLRRKRRLRFRIRGTPERPRLCVYRSLKHIYAQLIDDEQGRVLASCSSLDKEFKKTYKPPEGGGKVAQARWVGYLIGKRALELGVKKVVFDRNGFKYHGRVAAVADGAREAGLEF